MPSIVPNVLVVQAVPSIYIDLITGDQAKHTDILPIGPNPLHTVWSMPIPLVFMWDYLIPRRM